MVKKVIDESLLGLEIADLTEKYQQALQIGGLFFT